MRAQKFLKGAATATSLSLIGAFAYVAPKALEAPDIATRVACDVQAKQAEQSGAKYTPSLVCKMAARL